MNSVVRSSKEALQSFSKELVTQCKVHCLEVCCQEKVFASGCYLYIPFNFS